VTHAERVDDGIEGVGLERKRFCISLLEPDRGICLARHSDPGSRKVDSNRISSPPGGGAGNIARAGCNIQDARSIADARGVQQSIGGLGR
jgi:hypothetical protein